MNREILKGRVIDSLAALVEEINGSQEIEGLLQLHPIQISVLEIAATPDSDRRYESIARTLGVTKRAVQRAVEQLTSQELVIPPCVSHSGRLEVNSRVRTMYLLKLRTCAENLLIQIA